MKRYCNYKCYMCFLDQSSRCHLEYRNKYEGDTTLLEFGIGDKYNDCVFMYSKTFIETHIFEVLEIGE